MTRNRTGAIGSRVGSPIGSPQGDPNGVAMPPQWLNKRLETRDIGVTSHGYLTRAHQPCGQPHFYPQPNRSTMGRNR